MFFIWAQVKDDVNNKKQHHQVYIVFYYYCYKRTTDQHKTSEGQSSNPGVETIALLEWGALQQPL